MASVRRALPPTERKAMIQRAEKCTQPQAARRGTVTPEMKRVAQRERRPEEWIRARVADGRIVIPANPAHANLDPIGIGRELYTKINANIGNSSMTGDVAAESGKLNTALRFGADTVMDLSTGADIDRIRAAILAACTAPVGTVPIYQALAEVDDPMDLTADLLLDVIRAQAEQGVDYMTVHAGLLRAHIPLVRKRRMGIVSRGGSILANWMNRHGDENPLYARFDALLDICRTHDVTLSLGDGLRPGCLADASDEAQFAELDALGQLVFRCRDAGVQAMVEGPGHVPFDQIEGNMTREREICGDAPFYILGPVVTDIAPGYDHITSSMGALMGAFHGAAMLCYVTPKEHLGLPNDRDVREGVIAYKIAAHAADVALGRPGARDRDDAMADARMAFDWERQFELALDPARARAMRDEARREQRGGGEAADRDCLASDGEDRTHYCTMCGPKFCSMRLSRELMEEGSHDGV
jgi:phosphomethylpyrimidine synthase